MSAICPLGHTSDSDDYCDTCGSPIGAGPGGLGSGGLGSSGGATPAGAGLGFAAPGSSGSPNAGSGDGPAAAPAPQLCPNCDTVNAADALFCEACGYDFTTGVMPRPIALADGSYLTPVEPKPAAPDATGDAGDAGGYGDAGDARDYGDPEDAPSDSDDATPAAPGGETTVPESAERDATEPAASESAASDPAASDPAASLPGSDDPVSGEPDEPAADEDAGAGAPRAADIPSGKVATYRPPSRQTAKDWVVEVWIDPDWYAVQDSSEPCPSPGIPEIVPLHDGALIGRPSASRRIDPDIDVGTDTGVSRRQAILSTDGHRWWIEDLDSANGTFVGPASGPLPVDPIASRVEVDADDRIYVGAWTRLVVRPATESERAGQG